MVHIASSKVLILETEADEGASKSTTTLRKVKIRHNRTPKCQLIHLCRFNLSGETNMMRDRSEIKVDLRKCHQDMVTAEMSLDIRDLLIEIRNELKELNKKIQNK